MPRPCRLIVDFDETGNPSVNFIGEIPTHWLFSVAAMIHEQAMLPIRAGLLQAARQAAQQAAPLVQPASMVPRPNGG